MASWSIQQAASRFGELLEACRTEGPHTIADAGVEIATLHPLDALIQRPPRPTFQELLLADEPRFELDLPPRRRRGGPAP